MALFEFANEIHAVQSTMYIKASLLVSELV